MLVELEDDVESLLLDVAGGAPGGGPGGGPLTLDVLDDDVELLEAAVSPSWERKLRSADDNPAMPEASMDEVEVLADVEELAVVFDSPEALLWLAALACSSFMIRLC
ncbi:MAG: hypothetical protein P4L76_10350 [Beijerinckiaceae bacterium]|nr:hypothetical protein [Beijerinckiaceae bacterium]